MILLCIRDIPRVQGTLKTSRGTKAHRNMQDIHGTIASCYLQVGTSLTPWCLCFVFPNFGLSSLPEHGIICSVHVKKTKKRQRKAKQITQLWGTVWSQYRGMHHCENSHPLKISPLESNPIKKLMYIYPFLWCAGFQHVEFFPFGRYWIPCLHSKGIQPQKTGCVIQSLEMLLMATCLHFLYSDKNTWLEGGIKFSFKLLEQTWLPLDFSYC